MSVTRFASSILTILLIISLIPGSTAQSSSRVASAASQTSSQASSQFASPSSSQSSSQAVSPTSSEPLSLGLRYDDSCGPEFKDMISWAIDGAIQMAIDTVKDTTDHEHDPAFWELYGPRAVENLTSIRSAFEQIAHGPWDIEASCNIDDTDPACGDPFMYGGTGDMIPEGQAVKRDESQTFSAKLTFCQDFNQGKSFSKVSDTYVLTNQPLPFSAHCSATYR
jgi:hypothetical protein